MKHKITTLFIILGIAILFTGCNNKGEDHKTEKTEKKKRLTNPNNDVPVP